MVDPTNPGGAASVSVPVYSTSTKPFDKSIDLLTKEGISVWRSATDVDASAKRIALSVENGDNILARLKSKFYEYRLNKCIRIPTQGSGGPANTWGSTMHNYTEYKKLFDQYHELTKDQVAAYACYK